MTNLSTSPYELMKFYLASDWETLARKWAQDMDAARAEGRAEGGAEKSALQPELEPIPGVKVGVYGGPEKWVHLTGNITHRLPMRASDARALAAALVVKADEAEAANG
jgi:hypothetical protein